jgi:NADPH2:quinone reductase
VQKQYKKVILREFGGPERLCLESVDGFTFDSSKVEVAIAFAGVNRADILLREGKYHIKDLPITPGLEASGEIVRDGHGFRAGDRVLIYRAQSGMYSEQVRVDPTDLVKIPVTLSLKTAASIPLNWLTAYDCLSRLICIKSGQSMAIFAASSGVGQAAIQIAKGFGARPYAVVSSEVKAKYLADRFGIDALASTISEEIEAWILEKVGPKGVDGVLDLVGGKLFRTALRVTQAGGKIAQAANPSLEDSTINVRDFYPRNISIFGFQFGNLMTLKRDSFGSQLQEIIAGFESGIYRPADLTIYTPDQAAVAHMHLQDRTHVGKVLIQFREGK